MKYDNGDGRVTRVSVPTRACLSGEDLDWLGGRSVCVALDLPTTVTVGAGGGARGETGPAVDTTYLERHVVGVWNFLRRGYSSLPGTPAEVSVRARAPLASGLSTSTSLLVGLFQAFAEHYDLPDPTVSEWAYEYEFEHVQGGGMDQVAVLTGGVLLTKGVTRGLPEVRDAQQWPPAWRLVVLDSGTRKLTSTHIATVRRQLIGGDPSLRTYMASADEVSGAMWSAIEGRELHRVHDVLDRAHVLMRDVQQMSSPALERIRDMARRRCGIPFKLSGSGGGGALVSVFATENHGLIDDLRRHLTADGVRVIDVSAAPRRMPG
jgi:galactokinase